MGRHAKRKWMRLHYEPATDSRDLKEIHEFSNFELGMPAKIMDNLNHGIGEVSIFTLS